MRRKNDEQRLAARRSRMFRDIVHQHVSRLNADPDHARQQAHHSVRSITGRVIETLQACLLNLPDLIPRIAADCPAGPSRATRHPASSCVGCCPG